MIKLLIQTGRSWLDARHENVVFSENRALILFPLDTNTDKILKAVRALPIVFGRVLG